MICKRCEQYGKDTEKCFTQAERIQSLTAQCMLLRTISNANDKMVANSVITKLMMSFAPQSRDTLRQFIANSVGIDISIKDCPHSGMQIQA